MINFVRKNVKGGRCNAFIRLYKFGIGDKVFGILSKELNVNGKICDLLEKYFETLNKYEKLFARKLDSKYEDYRDIIRGKNLIILTKKLDTLPLNKELSKVDSKKNSNGFWFYKFIPFCLSAMWYEKSG